MARKIDAGWSVVTLFLFLTGLVAELFYVQDPISRLTVAFVAVIFAVALAGAWSLSRKR